MGVNAAKEVRDERAQADGRFRRLLAASGVTQVAIFTRRR